MEKHTQTHKHGKTHKEKKKLEKMNQNIKLFNAQIHKKLTRLIKLKQKHKKYFSKTNFHIFEEKTRTHTNTQTSNWTMKHVIQPFIPSHDFLVACIIIILPPSSSSSSSFTTSSSSSTPHNLLPHHHTEINLSLTLSLFLSPPLPLFHIKQLLITFPFLSSKIHYQPHFWYWWKHQFLVC